MDENKKKIILNGLLWRFFERTGAQIISFVVSLILARLLTPNDYGLIALVMVIINIFNVFVDSGLGVSLIQKKEADNIDFSTVFYFNLFFCLLLYSVIFFSSPLIANFYNRIELTNIIKVLGVTIVISGVKNIQQAYVFRNMQYKKFFFTTLTGSVISACAGIYMAYHNYGVWALVTQQLLNNLIDTALLWIIVKWRPKKIFSISRLKSLLSFGWKLLVSSLVDVFYTNLRQLVIGKKYNTYDLAYYNKGEQFPNVIVTNINSSIDSVLLPAMSSEQDNIEHIKNMTRRSIKTAVYLLAPLMMGLAACAPGIVKIVLTDKWIDCVPYLRIFCVTYMFWPIHTANLNALKALGRSDLFLKLEVIKKISGMIILLGSMWFGVLVMAYCVILQDVIAQIINSYPNKKLLGYSYIEQLRDIIPSIFIALLMGGIVSIFNFVQINDCIRIVIQIFSGIIIYVLLSLVFKLDSFKYILGLIKGYKNGKK